MTFVNTNIQLYLKTPYKSYGVSVLGLGHSDIRGLVTYRSMVRRELYPLIAWITIACADIKYNVHCSNLKMAIALSRCFQSSS